MTDIISNFITIWLLLLLFLLLVLLSLKICYFCMYSCSRTWLKSITLLQFVHIVSLYGKCVRICVYYRIYSVCKNMGLGKGSGAFVSPPTSFIDVNAQRIMCVCAYLWWWSLVAVGISCSHVLFYSLLFSQYTLTAPAHPLTANTRVYVYVYVCVCVRSGCDARVRTPAMNRKCHNFSINSSAFIMPLSFMPILIRFVFKDKKGYFSELRTFGWNWNGNGNIKQHHRQWQ